MSYERLPGHRPLDYAQEPARARRERSGRFVGAMLVIAIICMAAMFAAAVCVGCGNG